MNLLTVATLYPDASSDDPIARDAVARGKHLIRKHGYTLETLAEAFPANSGWPEADIEVLRALHGRKHA